MGYSRPFSRVEEAVAAIAEKYGEAKSTGNRLADNLELIAKNSPGTAFNIPASTAGTVAALKSDFNDLLAALKNAGVVTPDVFTITVTKDVSDTITGGGRADRQYNTDQISDVAYADGVITVTLSKAVSDLRNFDAGGNWGTHKWLGIGVSAGIDPITGLKYNGQSLTAEDVTEATQVSLSDGYFVRWIAADLVAAGDNSQASKDSFSLTANGYETLEIKLEIKVSSGNDDK